MNIASYEKMNYFLFQQVARNCNGEKKYNKTMRS